MIKRNTFYLGIFLLLVVGLFSAQTSTAQVGEALSFNGGIVVADDSESLDLTTEMSIELWVHPTSYEFWNLVVLKASGNTWDSGYGLYLYTGSGELSFFPAGFNSQLRTGYNVPLNQWTHVAATYDGSMIRVYANGTEVGNKALSLPIPTNDFRLGIGSDPGFRPFKFTGKVDEVRIWSKALTVEEIQANMHCEIPAGAPCLVANYHFNQGVAGGDNTSPAVNTLPDFSGNGNDGTLGGFAFNGPTSNWIAPGGVVSGTACGPQAECAFDMDEDEVADDVDNCPETPNTDQANNDGDMMGDACDPDDDNDGCLDVDDFSPFGVGPNPPCGFDFVSLGCTGDADYDASTQTTTLEATSCLYGNPYNQDEITFVSQQLCGDGEIIAYVSDVDTYGWAGIMIRESDAAGSKKVAIARDNGFYARREARTMTNGPAYPQQVVAVGKNWLRLQRQGNFVRGFISPNGGFWQQVMVVSVPMASCVEVGTFLTNKLPFQTISASFTNFSINGVQALPGDDNELFQGDIAQERTAAEGADVTVYPNPTSGPTVVDLRGFQDKDVRLEVQNTNGQILRQLDLGQTAERQIELHLNDLPVGIYWLRIQAEGEAPILKRILLQRV